MMPVARPWWRVTVPSIGYACRDSTRRRASPHCSVNSTSSDIDGLPPGEGIFLPCSFWLADNLAMLGRRTEAEALFDRLLLLRNDVGLIAEEYDTHQKRLLGNFPQAMTHVALINTARNLSGPGGPCAHRSRDGEKIPELQ